jgi:hypothetical protein
MNGHHVENRGPLSGPVRLFIDGASGASDILDGASI